MDYKISHCVRYHNYLAGNSYINEKLFLSFPLLRATSLPFSSSEKTKRMGFGNKMEY